MSAAIKKSTVRTVLITLTLFGMICTVMSWFVYLADGYQVPEWVRALADNPVIAALGEFYYDSFLFLINFPVSLANFIFAYNCFFRSKIKSKTSTVRRRYLVYTVISSCVLGIHGLILIWCFIVSSMTCGGLF